jgi:hypothetical protein
VEYTASILMAEDAGSMFLQNVDIYLQGHMASEVRENQH